MLPRSARTIAAGSVTRRTSRSMGGSLGVGSPVGIAEIVGTSSLAAAARTVIDTSATSVPGTALVTYGMA